MTSLVVSISSWGGKIRCLVPRVPERGSCSEVAEFYNNNRAVFQIGLIMRVENLCVTKQHTISHGSQQSTVLKAAEHPRKFSLKIGTVTFQKIS